MPPPVSEMTYTVSSATLNSTIRYTILGVSVFIIIIKSLIIVTLPQQKLLQGTVQTN